MTVLRRARDELQEKRPGSGSLRQDERYAKCCSNEVKAVARGLTVEREKLRRDDSQGKMVLVFRYFGLLLGGLCHQREIRIKGAAGKYDAVRGGVRLSGVWTCPIRDARIPPGIE